MPLALAQQHGMGYTGPGTWRHSARDWRSGRVVFPHTTPDGRLVHLYGRAVETKEQVPKAKRHDHPRTPRPRTPARTAGKPGMEPQCTGRGAGAFHCMLTFH